MPESEPQSLLLIIFILITGIVLGATAVWLWSRKALITRQAEIEQLKTILKSQEDIERERSAAMDHAEQRIASTFADLANKSLSQNNEQFLQLARENLGTHQERAKSTLTEREKAIEEMIKPIHAALEKTHKQITEIEKTRHEAFGNIKAQLASMANDQVTLQTETRNLVTALRRPEVRGQWGEMTLRRIAELAGMVEHCDFVEQGHVNTTEGAIRPDMIIRLPEQGEIVVDVKTPLDAYLQAVEAPDDETKKTALTRHARNVSERVKELASKAYWSQFARSPAFVILFIPGDQFLTAALSEKPELLEDALRNKVILATPTSLVALLKTIAYGWRQIALAENAEEIRKLAQDLHGRLGAFTGHLAKLGKQLESSVEAYNKAVGSLERNVLPGARKFAELGVQTKKPVDDLPPIEKTPRQVENNNLNNPAELPATDETDGNGDEPKQPH